GTLFVGEEVLGQSVDAILEPRRKLEREAAQPSCGNEQHQGLIGVWPSGQPRREIREERRLPCEKTGAALRCSLDGGVQSVVELLRFLDEQRGRHETLIEE